MFNVLSTDNKKLKINNEVLDSIRNEFLTLTVSAVKARIHDDLLTFLTPNNFIGEAQEYMVDHSIENSDDMVTLYSKQIFEEFKQNFEALIVYDEQNHKIEINQSIMDFEFGSYYKPVLKLITKSIELKLKDTLVNVHTP